jgi:hypothetical protein
MAMTASPCPRLDIVAPRVFSRWDHVSHKDFSPPLSGTSRFEANENQTLGEFDACLRRIRFKFEMPAIDSNFID